MYICSEQGETVPHLHFTQMSCKQRERKKERKSERGEISADALVKVETAKRKCLTVRTTFVVNSIKFKQCWSLNNTPVARLADEDCREER